MRNNFKSPLYYYIKSQLDSKNVAFLGGVNSINKLINLLETALEDCCTPKIKTHNDFLRTSQDLLRQLSFPHDRKKVEFVLNRLLIPFVECCETNPI